MLSALRNGAKSTPMRIFLIALAIGFAMWGIDDVFRSVSSNDAAVRAGKIEVSAVEAAIEFDRARRSYLPGLNSSEAISQGLLNEVLGGLARRALLTAEADRLNLTVTREMEKAHLANEPAFQDETGRFSALQFSNVISRADLDEASYFNYLRQDLLRAQLIDALTTGMAYPSNLVERIAAWRIERRIIDYVEVPVDIQAEADPVDSEIDSWYSENKDSYNSPDLRYVTALFLSPEILIDDVSITEDEKKLFYEDNINLYSVPERRALRQMIFNTLDEAQSAIDQINEGATFTAVAEDMLSLTDADTRLGALSREDLSEALIDPVFNAEQGVVIGPVSSLLGQHVLIVDKISAGATSDYSNVEGSIEGELKREAATDLVYTRIAEVEDELATGATLEEVANTTGSMLIRIDGMDRNGFDIDGQPIDEIADNTKFRQSVWTSSIGENGLVEETDADTYFVVRVDNETLSAERPLADVLDRVLVDIKTERAIGKARQAAENLAEANDIAATAAANGQNVITTPSFRRDGVSFDHSSARLIANKTFQINLDETAIVETGDFFIVITVTEIEPASGEALDAEIGVMEESLSQNIQTDLGAVMIDGLSEVHEIEVNPAIVETLLIGSLQ
jgi:peptidyl-prolyl cis-trans isomerase D